jgi:hypothetical protein
MSLFQIPGRSAQGAKDDTTLPAADGDPTLAFMLAQQAVTRWHFELERLSKALEEGGAGDAVATEAQVAIQQIAALSERIHPFSADLDTAVRFEAQEVLAALDALRRDFTRILRLLEPEPPFRDAAQLAASLQARRN